MPSESGFDRFPHLAETPRTQYGVNSRHYPNVPRAAWGDDGGEHPATPDLVQLREAVEWITNGD